MKKLLLLLFGIVLLASCSDYYYNDSNYIVISAIQSSYPVYDYIYTIGEYRDGHKRAKFKLYSDSTYIIGQNISPKNW